MKGREYSLYTKVNDTYKYFEQRNHPIPLNFEKWQHLVTCAELPCVGGAPEGTGRGSVGMTLPSAPCWAGQWGRQVPLATQVWKERSYNHS